MSGDRLLCTSQRAEKLKNSVIGAKNLNYPSKKTYPAILLLDAMFLMNAVICVNLAQYTYIGSKNLNFPPIPDLVPFETKTKQTKNRIIGQ